MEASIVYERIVGEELFQVDDVPALVCRQCGEQWIAEEVRENLERLAAENGAPGGNVQ